VPQLLILEGKEVSCKLEGTDTEKRHEKESSFPEWYKSLAGGRRFPIRRQPSAKKWRLMSRREHR
jgi:hypothetical protein